MAQKVSIYTENLGAVQDTLEQWLSFKRFLLKSYGEEKLTPDDEAAFLEIKSSVTKGVRTIGEKLKPLALEYGQTTIRDMLNRCVSLTHLRALPMPDRDQLLKSWHTVFVKMSRTVGALKFMEEGYRPPQPKKRKKAKKGGVGMNAPTIAVVLAAAAAAWWFFLR
jgi:hypothetical protein